MTQAQKKLLDFIEGYIEKNGYSPSYEDMAEGVGVKSKSGLSRRLHSLKDQGKVRFIPNMARTVEVVSHTEGCGGA